MSALVAVLEAPLRSGVPPVVALAAADAAFTGHPVLGPLVQDLAFEAAQGGSVAMVWRRHAVTMGSEDLRFVAQAWELTERTGAPLADALASASEVLRAHARRRERLASATAGPRASMVVLCLLPLTGPAVGVACGITPRELYLSTRAGTASLAAGLVLAGAAWWWSRRILARAE
ncbi:type II secretion system F family protein [Pedococcus sp. 5OH_020]|uniref:type II secretion system F family protein n=1 Tax=Pedococcus sp. 5OH_020 TaxID=2989814 RepID=UPI0022E9C2BC|nr:type II secretion system F family protein [Pedococcus sp. 5OH_020]